jgi:hypothetical protein
LGQIEEISAEPNSLFKSARVRSLVLPHEVTVVSIITPSYGQ